MGTKSVMSQNVPFRDRFSWMKEDEKAERARCNKAEWEANEALIAAWLGDLCGDSTIRIRSPLPPAT